MRANRKRASPDSKGRDTLSSEELVSMLAHELKTPMTVISGYSQLLLSGDLGQLPPEISEYLLVIQKNTQRAQEIVDGFRAFSNLKLDLIETNLDEVLKELIQTHRPYATQKGLILTLEGTSHQPHLVAGDAFWLRQLFNNLLSNAIKYTLVGKVICRISALSDAIEVEVADTGIGIQTEDQKKLFGSHFRANHPEVKKAEGEGLGLLIARRICQAHLAAISVESNLDVGTTVTVKFPRSFVES